MKKFSVLQEDRGLMTTKKNEQWYCIEDLALLTGFSVETLKKGNSPLNELNIDFEVDIRLGGYHNTRKYYSEKVLRALKAYQVRNAVPNATKEKSIVVEGNVSLVQQATVKQTIDNLLDNPETLNLLLSESLARNKALGIENRQLKEVVAQKTAVINRIADGKGCFTINQTAKALKLPYGNKKLFEKLKALGFLNMDNSPRQQYVNDGTFITVVKYINEHVGNKTVTLVTSSGLIKLAERLGVEVDFSVTPDGQEAL